jgi:CheY-like chemotaxis protein
MRKLLVIDDNLSVRESLRFLLLRQGYEVLVAEGGPQGIALAAEHRIDGALVDVQMPVMNGIDVCRLLREGAAAAGRDLPIWMMTGGRTPELVKRATEAGALALLGKPFDFADLFRRFEQQFGAAATHLPPSRSAMG